jgi:hypothetical protein
MKNLRFLLFLLLCVPVSSWAMISGANPIYPDGNTTYNWASTLSVDLSHTPTWSVSGPAVIVSQTAFSCVIKSNHTDLTTCSVSLTVHYYYWSDPSTSTPISETLQISRAPFITGPLVVYPGETDSYTIEDPCNSPFSCSYGWGAPGCSNPTSVAAWHSNPVSVAWPAVVPASILSTGAIGKVGGNFSCDAGSYSAVCNPVNITMELRPPTVTGPSYIPCGSITDVIYTANSTGATVYSWTGVPTGWIIKGYPAANSIQLQPNGSNGGTISVRAYATSGSVVNSTVTNYVVGIQYLTSINGGIALCPGTSATYTVASTPGGMSGPFTWTCSTTGWLINGSPSPVTSSSASVTVTAPSAPGLNTLSVTNASTCTPVTFQVSSNPPAAPVYLASNKPTVCVGGTLSWGINPVPYATSYNWTSSSAGIDLTPEGLYCSIDALTAGGKTVRVSASNQCGTGPMRPMSFDATTTGLCAARTEQKDGVSATEGAAISIYPNPASQTLTIDMQNAVSVTSIINLYDVSGKLVFSLNKTIENGNSLTEINVNSLTSGFYYLTVEDGTNVKREKIIVSH